MKNQTKPRTDAFEATALVTNFMFYVDDVPASAWTALTTAATLNPEIHVVLEAILAALRERRESSST